MQTIYLVILLIALAVMAVQDFKQRAISWIPLVGVFVFGILYGMHTLNRTAILNNLFFNTLFLILQLLAISFYFSIKEKRLVNIFNTYLGIGDVLFFIAIAGLFSTLNFIVYYTTGIILMLVWYGLIRIIKRTNQTIPLAGGLSLILFILLLTGFFSPDINILDDSIILAYL